MHIKFVALACAHYASPSIWSGPHETVQCWRCTINWTSTFEGGEEGRERVPCNPS